MQSTYWWIERDINDKSDDAALKKSFFLFQIFLKKI